MTRQSMRNIAAVLEQARSSLDKIVKTTIFVTDLSVFSAVNAAYAEFFKENLPARACVQVAALPKGASVEIEAIAYLCVVLKASALSAEKHPPICTYSRNRLCPAAKAKKIRCRRLPAAYSCTKSAGIKIPALCLMVELKRVCTNVRGITFVFCFARQFFQRI